ncbi:putative kinesin family protein (KlpA) [Aspergillus melleus]|uniref:putative kinesin family protein (KlpA) n=1 Tax=Aspergillus melleus TaxID=138277 RepID=UPI001E8CDBBE|nr:kinesin-like nuclear fusion protein [Aspergillus melleus]KAH8427100.1 kinesin-like nuclear fusion protein [Aspergillus melleus]
MENDYSTLSRTAGRTRIPAGLKEMSGAGTNSRSGLLPPGSIANKTSAVPQPTRARSTTQGAESSRSGVAPSTTTRSASVMGKPHTRANSYASTTLGRSASTTSRTTKSAYSSTVGPNARSNPGARPHTSMATTRRQNGNALPRPATSLDTHNEEDSRILGKRKGVDWDRESREKLMDEHFTMLMSRMNQTSQESFAYKETVELYKSRVNELEESRKELTESKVSLRVEIETLKGQLATADGALRDAQRDYEITVDEMDNRRRAEVEAAKQDNKKEIDALMAQHLNEMQELQRRFDRELDEERSARMREITQLNSQTAMDNQRTQIELERKEREAAALHNDIQNLRHELDRERKSTQDLRHNLDTASTNGVTMESSIRALKARIEFLEGGREEQSQAFERLNQQMMDALDETNATKEKLRKEETLRRKLHNQVQELKGNIRVFCRVRPSLNDERVTDVAQIQYPDESDDSKEICVMGPEEKSSLGTVSRKNNTFAFDRVFGPSAQNAEVFDEISQLVQSALDGYNVCIFCYGQTGSGKTHTMSSLDGMIPRAVHQIYETATGLEEKGWRYTMEGNFVEVYNENLNDLLGKAEELDKKKHEIRHDMQRGKTMITDITTVRLDSPEMVETILKRAASNRSVAATKANERSSRSHSVFILKLIGENHITGERSEGTLNLVDLAGSERLSQSGATGERLRETQNINRSLSCLGDVIAALGQGKEGGHIPYRNSKLTYLLQFSLGGNSKTLMLVMVSPLQAHLSESLTSLKFATKVHNTHIGTAKRQARVRDS